MPGWTHHAAPTAPDTVGTIMLKELDDVELVVVGTDVGLVQGAVIVLVDLQQAAQPGLAPGQRLGMGGGMGRTVPAGTQQGSARKIGVVPTSAGRGLPWDSHKPSCPRPPVPAPLGTPALLSPGHLVSCSGGTAHLWWRGASPWGQFSGLPRWSSRRHPPLPPSLSCPCHPAASGGMHGAWKPWLSHPRGASAALIR